MRTSPIGFLLLLIGLPLFGQVEYSLGPDSARHEGVPRGRIEQFQWKSNVYPGTERDVWVYIPAQYSAENAAAVMIFQDGAGFVSTEGASPWMTPVVLDNLIHQREMPVTIGIFVQPGVLPAAGPDQRERYNRSFEYDAIGPRYARFLIEEILPEVARRYELRLSEDPNLRGVAGSSSGGIAAFTAAWNRPDAFRRVLTFVGSFTDLRGGNVYPELVRKREPLPLRIYQQDGKNDQDIYGGSWFDANQELAAALKFAGYDHQFVIGEEGHNNRHGRAILPDALRWLWRDWTKPIQASNTEAPRHIVMEILDPGEGWHVVSEGHKFAEGLALAPNGDVYFTDLQAREIWKIDGKTEAVSLFMERSQRTNGMMFGPDGRLYTCRNGARQIVAINVSDRSEEIIADGVASNDIVVAASGDIYFTDPGNGKVWLINKDRELIEALDRGPRFPNGIMLSPDQSILSVADYRTKWVWSYQVQPDGTLASGQPFHRLVTGDISDESLADGLTVDSEGFLYIATEQGIQISDQPGRINAILNKPQVGLIADVLFAGPELRTLYVTAEDKVFKRKLRRGGVKPWEKSVPPRPRL
jgi:sugar lactone lactonase YvrE/enterochelin esterase-like enzyme